MPVWGEIESYSGCKTGTTMSFPSYQAHSATPVLRFITFREPTFTLLRTRPYLGKLEDIEDELVGVYDDIPHKTPKDLHLFFR